MSEKSRRRDFPDQPDSSIVSLFPSPTLVHVLQLLILHPDLDFYQREIAERASCRLLQAQRALRKIEEAGLLRKRRRGNRVYYSADRRHPVFHELKSLLLKTVALGDPLRKGLRGAKSKICLAFVFGSVASGTEVAASDIDMLVVGTIGSRELSAILGPLGRELGREFNPVLYSEEEFLGKLKAGNRFVREVLSGPKIWIVGSQDELEKMAA